MTFFCMPTYEDLLDWFTGNLYAVLPFGPYFPDFGSDPYFFEEIGPEMVRIYTKKSGFD